MFIDTWVGPGHAQGTAGCSRRTLSSWEGCRPPYQIGSIRSGTRPTARDIPTTRSPIRSCPRRCRSRAQSHPALRSFITGHGFGSADNCAEFCPLDHTFTINGTPYTRTVWRENCLSTGVPEQQGTWKYPRAGWCPGTDAYPILEDITADAQASDTLEFGYALQDYVNDCRPDAPVCMGCVGRRHLRRRSCAAVLLSERPGGHVPRLSGGDSRPSPQNDPAGVAAWSSYPHSS